MEDINFNKGVAQTGTKGNDGFVWLPEFLESLPEDNIYRRVISAGPGSHFSGYGDGYDAIPFLDHVRYVDLADKMGEKLIIGNYVCIGPDVTILMGGNQAHPLTAVSQHPLFHLDKGEWRNLKPAGNTIIEDDVWIGTDVMIMPGVKIGQGARILPRAVVREDVPPYALFGGVPGKVKRKRFNDQEIYMLMNKIRWTEWPEDVIREHVEDLLNLKPDFPKLVKIAEGLEADGRLPVKMKCGNAIDAIVQKRKEAEFLKKQAINNARER